MSIPLDLTQAHKALLFHLGERPDGRTHMNELRVKLGWSDRMIDLKMSDLIAHDLVLEFSDQSFSLTPLGREQKSVQAPYKPETVPMNPSFQRGGLVGQKPAQNVNELCPIHGPQDFRFNEPFCIRVGEAMGLLPMSEVVAHDIPHGEMRVQFSKIGKGKDAPELSSDGLCNLALVTFNKAANKWLSQPIGVFTKSVLLGLLREAQAPHASWWLLRVGVPQDA